MITIKLYDDDNIGGSRGAEDLILPGTGGAGSRPSIRGLNVAVSVFVKNADNCFNIYFKARQMLLFLWFYVTSAVFGPITSLFQSALLMDRQSVTNIRKNTFPQTPF